MSWKYKAHLCQSCSRENDFSSKFRCRRVAYNDFQFPPVLYVTDNYACGLYDQANKLVLVSVPVVGSEALYGISNEFAFHRKMFATENLFVA